jgi:hypothetical protein
MIGFLILSQEASDISPLNSRVLLSDKGDSPLTYLEGTNHEHAEEFPHSLQGR